MARPPPPPLVLQQKRAPHRRLHRLLSIESSFLDPQHSRSINPPQISVGIFSRSDGVVVRIGSLTSSTIYKALNKYHGMSTTLRKITGKHNRSDMKLWHKVVFDQLGSVRIEDDRRVESRMIEGRRKKNEDVGYVKGGIAELKVAN